MNYQLEKWTIADLIKNYEEGFIDLNPPYQRNYIWTMKAQKELINTIKNGQPIPNFFMRRDEDGSLEMVDGQQRARTIFGYYNKLIPDKNKELYAGDTEFLEYRLSITIISDLLEGESIEDYYALVNSSGLRLNRPELKKAEHYDTNFLRLLHKLVELETFQNLNLFTASSANRMNDVELVSELVALLEFGIFDKKTKVDELYKNDITEEKYNDLFKKFNDISDTLSRLNLITPISKTRYRQRNDLYTLFSFLYQAKGVPSTTIDIFYQILLKIGPHISPSQENCDPLKEYAVNCVTQSNSKKAREARHQFLVELLLNTSDEPNLTQAELLDYYEISKNEMTQISGFLTLDPSKLNDND